VGRFVGCCMGVILHARPGCKAMREWVCYTQPA
jgi:hypothetical protein